MPFSKVAEAKALVCLSMPIFLSNLAMFGMSMTVLVTAGHLGPAQLTAVAYAEMIFDITIMIFALGFIVGQGTLSAQAFGAKNLPLIGKYCQMNCLCVTIACIPISTLWWYCGDMLQAAGVSRDTSVHAKEYAHISALWLWPRLIYQVLTVYFKSMQNVVPAAVFAVLFAVLNVATTYILVEGLSLLEFDGLGLAGCPISLTLCHYSRLIAFVLYMFVYKNYHKSSWSWSFSFLNITYLMPMVKVGGPMVIGQLVENLQLQTISLFAAMTSEGALGANNAMLELFLFLSSPIFGLIDGGSTRISMYLGAGKAQSAKLSSHVVFYCIFGTSIFVAIPWLCARKLIGAMFSSDPTISESLTSISTLAASGYVVMSFFYYSMATLQAQARTVPIMISFLVGSWIIGVPMAYVFGFFLRLALFGIWMGLCLGYLITTLFGTYFTYKSNWVDEAKKAVARSKITTCDEAEPFLLEKTSD